MSFAISGVNLELNHETCDRHEAGILRRSMHRKRGAPDSPRIVADAKETACTRVISSPYRITESAEILSRLNPLPNPALLGFQSVEIQARQAFRRRRDKFALFALGRRRSKDRSPCVFGTLQPLDQNRPPNSRVRPLETFWNSHGSRWNPPKSIRLEGLIIFERDIIDLK